MASSSSTSRGARAHVRTVVSSDGCRIYADAVGDSSKPALVFIHGYTLCAAVWDDIFADRRNSEQFFLVRYDTRGHGRSGKPVEMSGYRSELYADDFAAVCAEFGVKRPLVVPWSLGATVVPDIASHLPINTLAGIAYLAPCPYIGPIMQKIGTPFILNLLTTLSTSDEAVIQEKALDDFADSCFMDPFTIDWKLRASWRGMGTFVRREQRKFVTTRAQDPSALLALVSGKAIDRTTLQTLPPLPVHLQIGAEDSQIFPDILEAELRPFYRNLEFVVLPNRGHSIHVEAREEVMDRILRFARKVYRLPTPISPTLSESTSSDSAELRGDSSSDEDDDVDRISMEDNHRHKGLRAGSFASPISLFRSFTSLRQTFRSSPGYR